MATMDGSPSLFAGQSWTTWAANVPLVDGNKPGDELSRNKKDDDSDTMKLRKTDMPLFGQCPAQDEFYLAVCEKCEQVVKPQALKQHIEQRHGGKDASHKGSPSVSPSYKPCSVPTKASFKQGPHITNQTLLNAKLNSSYEDVMHCGMPVVKVERIPDLLTIRSIRPSPESTPTAKSAMTNGTNYMKSTQGVLLPSPTTACTPVHPLTASQTLFTLSASDLQVSATTISVTTVTPSVTTVTPIACIAPTINFCSPVAMATVATTTASTVTMVATGGMNPLSSGKKSNGTGTKERKLLCKDREFDADKHCGVILPELGKPCTRSLTCKTHALSLRRGITGRSKPFDALLKEHREIKEALQKAKAEAAAATHATKQAKLAPAVEPPQPPCSTNATPPHQLPGAKQRPSSTSGESTPCSFDVPTTSSSNAKPPTLTNVVQPSSISLTRRNYSGGHSPYSSCIKEDVLSPSTDAQSRLSSDDEDGDSDPSYMTHHPRPAAMCTFGARQTGGGQMLFNRKTDFLRAAFLNVLERHLHPPPHKKLCVESKLPKETHVVGNSKDPYEFNMVDTTMGCTNHLNSSINSTPKGPVVKQKSVPTSSSAKPAASKPTKSRENNGSKSPGNGCNTQPASGIIIPTTTTMQLNIPSNVKRKRNSGNALANPVVTSGQITGTATGLTLGSLNAGQLSFNSHPVTPLPVPNVNLSNATLNHFNATLPNVGKPGQLPQNINLKDLRFVITGIGGEGNSIVNGQYVSFSSAHLADGGTAANQIISMPQDEKALSGTLKKSRSGIGGSSNKNAVIGNKLLNSSNIETFHALHGNSVLAGVAPNTFFVTDAMQTGAMLTPVTLATIANSSGVTISNTSRSSPQQSPSTTPNPLFRSDTVSPQVTASSPLPNGIIPSSSEKVQSSGSHHHSIHWMKSSGQSLQKPTAAATTVSGIVSISARPPVHGFQQICTSQVLPSGGLTQIKGGSTSINLSKGATNKLPLPVTIPYITPSGTQELIQLSQQLPSSPSNVIS